METEQEQENFDLEAYFRFLELIDMGNEQINIGSLRFINPKLLQVIQVVSDRCLANVPNHEYIGPDGTLLRLENWQEKRRAALETNDGVLRMPRYRFRRVSMGNPWERATYIQAKADALEVALRGYHLLDEFSISGADLTVAQTIAQLQKFLGEWLTASGLDDYLKRQGKHK